MIPQFAHPSSSSLLWLIVIHTDERQKLLTKLLRKYSTSESPEKYIFLYLILTNNPSPPFFLVALPLFSGSFPLFRIHPYGCFSAGPSPERSSPSLFQPSSTPFASDPPSFAPPAFPGASDPFGGSPPFVPDNRSMLLTPLHGGPPPP